MDRLTVPPSLWRAFTGYGLWAVCFTALYTGHALGCAWISAASGRVLASPVGLTAGLAMIWMFFILWLLVLTVRSGLWLRAISAAQNGRQHASKDLIDRCFQYAPHSSVWPPLWRRSARFMVVLTLIADASALAVTVVSGLPVVMTPACM